MSFSEKIGVVTSEFNQPITDQLKWGAIEELKKQGVKEENLLSVSVPGAYEIPLAAQWLIEEGCEAVLCLGSVIRGETSHYDYVCNAVERGCSNLQLKNNIPVTFGVLTTENKEQALDRLGGKKGHKGVECAQALLQMLRLKNQLKNNK